MAVKCKNLKTPSWLRFLVNLKITVLVGLTFSLLILPWAFLGRLGLGGGGQKCLQSISPQPFGVFMKLLQQVGGMPCSSIL